MVIRASLVSCAIIKFFRWPEKLYKLNGRIQCIHSVPESEFQSIPIPIQIQHGEVDHFVGGFMCHSGWVFLQNSYKIRMRHASRIRFTIHVHCSFEHFRSTHKTIAVHAIPQSFLLRDTRNIPKIIAAWRPSYQ